jgi:type 1 glutamine amidotransferase
MIRFITICVALGYSTVAFADAPKKLLLVGQGPDGHPPTTHEYLDGLKVLQTALEPIKKVDITLVKADGKWENGPELIERSDGIVLFVSEGAKWIRQDEKRLAALKAAAKRGAGLVCLHWGMGCKDAEHIEDFVTLFGGCHGGPDRKYQVVETELMPADKHPIATGLSPFKIKDEFYYKLKLAKSVKPALNAKIDGESEIVAWSLERPDGGRSFGFSGLHFHSNWKQPEYRRLVGQGVLWTLKLPVPEKGLVVGE